MGELSRGVILAKRNPLDGMTRFMGVAEGVSEQTVQISGAAALVETLGSAGSVMERDSAAAEEMRTQVRQAANYARPPFSVRAQTEAQWTR